MSANMRGAILMILAMAGFAIEDALIKYLAADLPSGQIVVMIGVGGALVFAVLCIRRGFALFPPAFWSAPVLTRNGFEMFGSFCFIKALTLIPLSTLSAILQATPLVVVSGAALFLGEKVGWRRWSAIFIGFFGVLLILRPGMAGFDPLSLWAVGGMLGLAGRDLAVRRVPSSVDSLQIAFFGFLAVIPVGLALLWTNGAHWIAITPPYYAWWVVLILFGVFAYYAIIAATRSGDVGFVTPFRYSRLVFALIIGMVVFAERPDALMLLGAAIVVTSGLYTLWRERVVH